MPGYATPRPRRRSFYRSLPVWAQWTIPFAFAIGLIVALVMWVNYETNSVPQEAGVNNPRAIAEQNREANVLIRQDQAPHVVRLPTGLSSSAAIRKAVVAYMSHKISRGIIDGPITRSRCSTVAGGTRARQVFRCSVLAASVTYPFEGVVEPASRRVTYCKRDKPPIPSMNIPLSARCT